MWRSLTTALQTGKPQTGFEAKEHFGSLYSEPQRLEAFMRGMTGATLPVARAVASRFPWHDYNTVVDVGTAQGCLPAQIALVHPHINGGGFDLPMLKTTFDTYVERYGLSDRLQFFPGTSIPIRCLQQTCWSWVGYCTTGTSQQNRYC